MSFCIIIRGPLGVGKTTVAKALAERLAAHYISIDEMSASHNLDETDEECIPVENFMRVNKLVLPQVFAALAAGQVVVFDGNFYYLQQLKHLEQLVDAPVYSFTLHAPLSVCVKRDSQRQQVYGVEAAATVHYAVSRVDYGINIDTENQTLTLSATGIKVLKTPD